MVTAKGDHFCVWMKYRLCRNTALYFCCKTFNLSYKIFCRVCHILKCGWDKVVFVVLAKEVVCLKGEVTLIADFCDCLTDICPVKVHCAGKSVVVVNIVCIVNMQTADTFAAQNPKHILCSSAAKSAMTDIKAGCYIFAVYKNKPQRTLWLI